MHMKYRIALPIVAEALKLTINQLQPSRRIPPVADKLPMVSATSKHYIEANTFTYSGHVFCFQGVRPLNTILHKKRHIYASSLKHCVSLVNIDSENRRIRDRRVPETVESHRKFHEFRRGPEMRNANEIDEAPLREP